MTTALVVLALVALALWLSAARPSPSVGALSVGAPPDRDHERQLGELRAMARSRADVHL